MKFLIFFMLLVNTKSFEFDGFGKKINLPTAELIKFIGEIGENEDFYKAINMEYTDNYVLSINNTNILVAFEKTNDYLEMLKKMFTNEVKKNVSKYLISLCTEIIELIDQMPNEENITPKMIHDIKVARDYGYCIVTFLYNCGADVEIILQVMIFLQTYFDGEIIEHKYKYLRRTLVEYINQLTDFDSPENFLIDNDSNDFTNINNYDSNDKTNVGYEHIELDDSQPQQSENIKLEKIKKIFTTFSNKFCVSTVPKVIDIENSPMYKDEHYRHQMLNYTFEKEGCEVKFQKFVIDNLASQDTIFKWECKNILESQIYGLIDYLNETRRDQFIPSDDESVSGTRRDQFIPSDDGSVSGINTDDEGEDDTNNNTNNEKISKSNRGTILQRLNKKCRNYQKKISYICKTKKNKEKAIAEEQKNRILFIEASNKALKAKEAEKKAAKEKAEKEKAAREKAALEMAANAKANKITSRPKQSINVIHLSTLKNTLKSFYLSAVNYNNIISDIIILVSIKEGEKLIESITFLFWKSYHYGDFDKKRYMMRQQLIIFQIFLDKLADKILEKLLIDVTEKTEMKLFEKKVETILKTLNTSVIDMNYEIEDGEGEDILALISNEPNVFFGNQFYFDEFYFAFSIMHVYEFIHFINS